MCGLKNFRYALSIQLNVLYHGLDFVDLERNDAEYFKVGMNRIKRFLVEKGGILIETEVAGAGRDQV